MIFGKSYPTAAVRYDAAGLDKFGVSWQIAPAGLTDMLNDPDPDRSQRVMRAMMQMVKLDIAVLKSAWEGQ